MSSSENITWLITIYKYNLKLTVFNAFLYLVGSQGPDCRHVIHRNMSIFLKAKNYNTLKHGGYNMYHYFNIQNLLILPSVYLRVRYDSHN
jgi:hypothetical protein